MSTVFDGDTSTFWVSPRDVHPVAIDLDLAGRKEVLLVQLTFEAVLPEAIILLRTREPAATLGSTVGNGRRLDYDHGLSSESPLH